MNTEINTANFRIQNDYNEELRESNSKMITVGDEMLETVINMKR